MANVIPDTDSVEVAKIAAALYLIGVIHSSNYENNLREFAKAFKVVSAVISSKGDVDVQKLLADNQPDK